MATKYEEAAFLNNNNTFEILTLDEAVEYIIQDEKNYHQKYNGKLYCPECHCPQIGIVHKNNSYFFRGYPKAVHDSECNYGFETVKSDVLQEFATEEDNCMFLNEKLQRFVNRLLNRDNNHLHNLLLQIEKNKCLRNEVDLSKIHNRRSISRIPTKSIVSSFDDDDFNRYMLFYGKVDVLYSKIEKTKVPFYKLTFLKCGTNYKFCSLAFSEKVAIHVQNRYQFNFESRLTNVYVAFFSEMKKEKNKYLNAWLKHSELLCIASE